MSANLPFPKSPATYFGNLPPTAPGVYYDFGWLRSQLQADASAVAYEQTLARIHQAVIVLAMLTGRPIGTEQLAFKIGAVEQNNCRRILMTVNGYTSICMNASITVLLEEKTGELRGAVRLQIDNFEGFDK